MTEAATTSLTAREIAYKACHEYLACQNPDELAGLLELIEQEKPRTVLEVGTCRGATFYAFAQVAADDATMISVDHGPTSPVGHRYATPETLLGHLKPGQKLIQEWGDSQDAAMAARIDSLAPEIDFLFIDADHHLAGVCRDHALYAPLVRPGGIVAFHDIDHQNHETFVNQFWDAIKPLIVEGWEWRRGLGIGAYRTPAA